MVSTLGEAHDHGWKIRVRCAFGPRDGMKRVRECTKQAYLDVGTLVWTRGREMPLAVLGDRLKCPGCGSRVVAVYFIPPDGSGRVGWGMAC